MFASYEVGAIFSIEDAASPTLERLSGLFDSLAAKAEEVQKVFSSFGKGEGLFSGVTAGINEVKSAFTGLGRAAIEASDAIVNAMERSSAAAKATAVELGAVAQSLRSTAFASGGGGGGGGGGGLMIGGGGAGGRGGSNLPSIAGGPGGGGGGGGTMPPIGVGGGGGGGAGSNGFNFGLMELAELVFGIREFRLAGEEDLALRQGLESMNIRPEDKGFESGYKQMARIAQEATDRSVFSEPEGAKALAHFAGIMIGTGEMGMDQVEDLFPIAARAGELSHQRGKGSLADEAVAAGEFPHMMGNYKASAMIPMLDLINAISKRTDTSLQEQMAVQRYGLPLAMAAGIDPQRAAIDIGFSEINQGRGTRAGSSYGQFITYSMADAQAKTPQQRRAREKAAKEFEESLKLEEGPDAVASHRSGMKEPKRITAQKELGLIDPVTGKRLNIDAQGNLNEDFEKAQIARYGDKMVSEGKKEEILPVLVAAFGMIGARYAEMFLKPEAQANEALFRGDKEKRTGVLGAPTVEQEQADLMKSFLQKLEGDAAQLDTIFSTLAGATLPLFGHALDAVSTGLGGVVSALRAHPEEQPAIAGSLVGLIASGLGTGGNWLARNTPGMKGVLGRGAGSIMRGLGGFGAWLGLSSLLHDSTQSFSDMVIDRIEGEGSADKSRKALQSGKPSWWPENDSGLLWNMLPGPRAASAATTAAPAGPRASAPSVINNFTLTLNGYIDEAMKSNIVTWVTNQLSTSMAHASTEGQGTPSSPYTLPGAIGF